jgi:hypothetical protein
MAQAAVRNEASSTATEETSDGVEPEITEEEERVNDELFAHPTRDDVHEQRERGQMYEAVIHAHLHITWRGSI